MRASWWIATTVVTTDHVTTAFDLRPEVDASRQRHPPRSTICRDIPTPCARTFSPLENCPADTYPPRNPLSRTSAPVVSVRAYLFILKSYTKYSVRQKKGNAFVLWMNLFYTQCNLTKFSICIATEYCNRCYLFDFWNLHTNFRRVPCKSVT